MVDKKVSAMVGSTGAQDGGLVRAIVNDKSGGLTARALSEMRTPAKPRNWPSLALNDVQEERRGIAIHERSEQW
ncbi:MAG: hypothetical protein ACT4OO_07770 [Nitrospiraceae bacterium]